MKTCNCTPIPITLEWYAFNRMRYNTNGIVCEVPVRCSLIGVRYKCCVQSSLGKVLPVKVFTQLIETPDVKRLEPGMYEYNGKYIFTD